MERLIRMKNNRELRRGTKRDTERDMHSETRGKYVGIGSEIQG